MNRNTTPSGFYQQDKMKNKTVTRAQINTHKTTHKTIPLYLCPIHKTVIVDYRSFHSNSSLSMLGPSVARRLGGERLNDVTFLGRRIQSSLTHGNVATTRDPTSGPESRPGTTKHSIEEHKTEYRI